MILDETRVRLKSRIAFPAVEGGNVYQQLGLSELRGYGVDLRREATKVGFRQFPRRNDFQRARGDRLRLNQAPSSCRPSYAGTGRRNFFPSRTQKGLRKGLDAVQSTIRRVNAPAAMPSRNVPKSARKRNVLMSSSQSSQYRFDVRTYTACALFQADFHFFHDILAAAGPWVGPKWPHRQLSGTGAPSRSQTRQTGAGGTSQAALAHLRYHKSEAKAGRPSAPSAEGTSSSAHFPKRAVSQPLQPCNNHGNYD